MRKRPFPAARPGLAAARSAIFFFFLASLSACAFRSLEDFAVLSVSIGDGGVIGTGRREIEIVFSKAVGSDDAEDGIRVERDSSTEVPLRRRVRGSRVVLEPEREWEPHRRYWLVVDKGLKDLYGRELGRGFCLPFQSTEELIPVSAALVVPEVRGGVVAEETNFLRILFSAGVDRGSVERAFSCTPFVGGQFEWDSDRELAYRFNGNLRKNTVYTVSIAAGALDGDRHAIKPFSRPFEYFPNRDHPAVERIVSGGRVLFDRSDPATYTLQEGIYVVDVPLAEKDLSLVVYFSDASDPIDRSTFREGLGVSPAVDLREEWLDDYTVRILSMERLELGKAYDLRLTRRISDRGGLTARYELLVALRVNGIGSRFLEFYAGEFAALDVDARLSIRDGLNPPSVVEVEKSAIVKGVDACGPYLLIPYAGPVDAEEIAVELLVGLVFAYAVPSALPPPPAPAPPGPPVLDRFSLQESVAFSAVFGQNPLRGGIGSFDWPDDETDRCTVRIVGAGSGNVYRFSVEGGQNGVVDDLANHMAEDVRFYFKLIVGAGEP